MPLFTLFPLFRKELTEQAARKRTYLVRVLFAMVVIAVFLAVSHRLFTTHRYEPTGFLGSGRMIFSALTGFMFVGIHVLLPALIAGAIPAERERGSLELLRVTDLRPTEVLLEKFLSRILLMLTLLLTTLPVLALVYSFGGVTSHRLYVTIYMLFLSCLQVGALSLMFSAACKTTVRAVIGAYIGCIVLYGILPVVMLLDLSLVRYLYSHLMLVQVIQMQLPVSDVLLETLPIPVSAVVFIVLGRIFLTRSNASAAPGVSGVTTGGVRGFRSRRQARRIHLKHGLPEERPVAWREAGLTRRPLLLGALIVGDAFLFLFLLAVIPLNLEGSIRAITFFMVFLNWAVAVLVVSVRSANLLISERVRQTLDVLLTSPLTGKEIIHQKIRGLSRTWKLFFWILLPFFLVKALWLLVRGDNSWYGESLGPFPYLVISILAVCIYLPLTSYYALWNGLQLKTPTRATLTTLFSIAGVCAVPPFLLASMGMFSDYAFLLTPIYIVGIAETGRLPSDVDLWGMIFLNFTIYGLLLVAFRHLCLSRAEKYLGRVEEREQEEEVE